MGFRPRQRVYGRTYSASLEACDLGAESGCVSTIKLLGDTKGAMEDEHSSFQNPKLREVDFDCHCMRAVKESD